MRIPGQLSTVLVLHRFLGSLWMSLIVWITLTVNFNDPSYGQEQSSENKIPLTNEEFQKRVKSKQIGPFITELDLALAKSPNDISLLGIELQVSQHLLIHQRDTGVERIRNWIQKLNQLPRSAAIDKLLVAGVFNATIVQDPKLAKEFIGWIDSVTSRIPPGENITQTNLQGNRLSLQGLIENRDQVEVQFNQFFTGLEQLVVDQKLPVAVMASQAMRYKSLFWDTHRDESMKKIMLARRAYANFLKQPVVSPTDVLVYIQFMTTLASEISKDLPKESYQVLNELKEQLQFVQTKLPEEQSKGLQATISNIEQGLKQLAMAIRQLDLIGTKAPPLIEAKYKDVPTDVQKQLEGKIVLLAFWAAWSQPCLKSLDRIEQTRKEFQDQGLLVIGVTKSYGMVWDESSKTATRQSDVPIDSELDSLVSIAQHHGSQLSIAILPEASNVYDAYEVSGIPQLVLIGSDGLIKLIKPGLNENQFKAIDDEIRKLVNQ